MADQPHVAALYDDIAFAETEFAAGRPGGYQDLYAHSEDISIFGAFGGHELGWDEVGPRLAWAAAQFQPGARDGHRTMIASSFGSDVGYTVWIDRSPSATTVAGTDEMRALRVTHVYRFEDDRWRIVHRHADPLVEKRPPGPPAA